MLFAMLSDGGNAYRFSYDLLIDRTVQPAFTVPAGVTQITFLAQGRGGPAGPAQHRSPAFAGAGGGGGGTVLYVNYTVTPGNTISVTGTLNGSTPAAALFTVRKNSSTFIFFIEEGLPPQLNLSDGGRGGGVTFLSSIANGGNGGIEGGALNGNDGDSVSVSGGGYIFGGGGGGAGVALSPPGSIGGIGGKAGSSTPVAYTPTDIWGGGGGGVFSDGQSRFGVGAGDVTSFGANFIKIFYN